MFMLVVIPLLVVRILLLSMKLRAVMYSVLVVVEQTKRVV